MLLGDGEEVLGRVAADAVGALGVAEAGGEHAEVDAGVVHRGDQALDRGALGEVGAEELEHALLLVLRRPLGGERLGEEVHPAVHDHRRTLPDTTVRNGGREYDRAMHDLGFRPFDADNHYYEAEDAFIRHIDPAMQKRCMQWAEVNGKKRLLVGGKINKFIPNPTFDPIAAPGALEDYFRGRNEDGIDMKTMFGDLDPIAEHPGYRHRDARVRAARRAGHGRRAAVPHARRRHAGGAAARRARAARRVPAFNTWLDEDWGFDRGDGRLYAAPMITFADADQAAAEVERVLGMGARILVTIPGPVPDGDKGYVSPGHAKFDKVWGLHRRAGRAAGAPRRAQRREPVRRVLEGAPRPAAAVASRRFKHAGVPAGGLRRPRHQRHLRRADLPRRARALPRT